MVVKVSLESYNKLWPGWGKEMGLMMNLWGVLKDRSWAGLPGDHVQDTDDFLSVDDKKSIVKT
jgi:hypothetical protein